MSGGHSDLISNPRFVEICSIVGDITQTTLERRFAIYSAIQYLSRSGVKGDVVECGVRLGGSLRVAEEAIKDSGLERGLVGFDFFGDHRDATLDRAQGNAKTAVLHKTDLMSENFAPPKLKIGLLHIDIGDPLITETCLDHFYPIVSVGGVILAHDEDRCVEEYFDGPTDPFVVRIDYATSMVIKNRSKR